MEQIISGKFQPRDDNWVPACWQENRNKFPPEELLQYVGKHIAWKQDGSHIVCQLTTTANSSTKSRRRG